MKIAVAYVAVVNGSKTSEYISRFVGTWKSFPPGTLDVDVFVMANGGVLSSEQCVMLTALNARMFPRSNEGWDIGAYIEAARGPCAGYDMMVCCGESIYFHRVGWLRRLVESWQKIGPGMYGSLSSNLIRPHLNTTGFCCPPVLLSDYRAPVRSRDDRYQFEHGANAFWRQVQRRGMPVRLVTWDGEYEPRSWRCPPNILWRGDQSNLLMWCQHTDRYVSMDAATKAKWARNADRPFK